MKTVYVAGPYTTGDTAANVNKAIETAEVISFFGLSPYIPHLTHLWHMIFPHNYDFWINHDLVWLKKCDALFRIEGESPGAEREIEEAIKSGIPVFYNLADLQEWGKG